MDESVYGNHGILRIGCAMLSWLSRTTLRWAFDGTLTCAVRSPRVKRQLPVLFVDPNRRPRLELPAEEGVGQGVLQAVLDHAAEGSRSN